MSKRIDTGENLLGSFPYSLSRDDDKNKVAECIADELAKTVTDTEMAKIFPTIDSLPETVLDMLAYDLKVEWYEYNAPIKNKRITIKECILVHKHKGTKFAVEAAVHSLYDRANVQEWFEYSGEPFHFRIKVYGSSSGGIKTLGQKILYAKNLRSVLDSVAFVLVPESDLNVYVGMANAALKKSDKAEIISDDEPVYSTQAVEIFAGTITDGISKHTYADMQIETDYGTATFELAAKFGIAVQKAKRRCVPTQLSQQSPLPLQSARVSIKTGAATAGAIAKRIYADLQSTHNYGAADIDFRAAAGSTIPRAKRKRIVAKLYYQDQSLSQSAVGNTILGAAQGAMFKRISTGIYQQDQTTTLTALGNSSAGVAADGISKIIKVEVKQV